MSRGLKADAPGGGKKLSQGRTMGHVRMALAERLRACRPELEQALLARVQAISDSCEADDHDYVEGLRTAVLAAMDYGVLAIERGERHAPPAPAALRDQARRAARSGVGLDTIMRRYFAGYTLLGDFATKEIERDPLARGDSLNRLLREQAILFDRLLVTVSEEYNRELNGRTGSPEQRRADWVRRLLVGEPVESSDLNYEFGAFHLGMIASGPGAGEAIRDFASRLDKRLLLIFPETGLVWAWLGSHHVIDLSELEQTMRASLPAPVSLAAGEPGKGLAGWRFSYRQARVAFPLAQRDPDGFVRYSQVALLASMIQDDLLATSLHELYLAPLDSVRGGGLLARETLRAYFETNRNISSAAASLSVNRNTFANRLRSIEARIGAPLNACAADLEAALRLEELE